MARSQRIRDPLHNLVEFRANSEIERILWKVLNSRPFQRLRRIKQLGFSDLVYPGATHSRFAHSVGVFHTARKLMSVVEAQLPQGDFKRNSAEAALAAALVHDVGHGPYSHAFEAFGKRFNLKLSDHETVSDELIRNGEIAEILNEHHSGFAEEVADIILKRDNGPRDIYDSVVSSQFDADRLDYMRRDRMMAGSKHAEIDFQWLIANLEIGKVKLGVDEEIVGERQTFILGPKAIYAAEAYVLGLFQLYPTIYFHKATRGAEKLFVELMSRIFTLVTDGKIPLTRLPASHPIVKFSKKPDKIENIQCLDDTVIWGALPLLVESKDEILSNFASRLLNRKLYKSINVREEIKKCNKDDGTRLPKDVLESRIDGMIKKVKSDLKSWSANKSVSVPRILFDEARRQPYKTISDPESALNQIWLSTLDQGLVDIKERSDVVRAIQTFRLFRAYHAPEDREAEQVITRTIQEAVKKDENDVKLSV